MTKLNLNSRVTPFGDGVNDEAGGANHVAFRFAILVPPVTLTARLLGLWFYEPAAWAASTLVWMVLIYWLPGKPNISFRKWLIVGAALSMLLFCLAVITPAWL